MMNLRLMRSQDFRPLLEMAGNENWLSDEKEFSLILAYNPYGCFVLGEDEVSGGIMTYTHGRSAWIGNLIVSPGLRGRGLGSRLLQKAVDYLRDSGYRSIYLCAAAKAAPLYSRFGFREVTAINRWQGIPAPAEEFIFVPGLEITPNAQDITGLDTASWGDNRSGLLNRLAALRTCFYYPDRSGFIMYGRLGPHMMIGPWTAEGGNYKLAEGLLKVVLAQTKVKSRTCFLDVPEDNQAAGRMLEEAGFQKFNARLLMCLGSCPKIAFQNIFALASLGSIG